MKLLLVTGDLLLPYVDSLIPNCPHRIDTVYLPKLTPDAVRSALKGVSGYDAVLLPDGAAALDDDGLACGDIPLILPRVHNCVSLLIGAHAYRRIFCEYNGGVCWYLPSGRRELYFSPSADCACLCYIADTALGIRDDSVAARAAAQRSERDFFSAESDIEILHRLLWGDWDDVSFQTVEPGGVAVTTSTRELVAQDMSL